MASTMDPDSDEAMTKEELEATEPPQVKDAFAELMSSRPNTSTLLKPPHHHAHTHSFKDRMALGAYITDPASFPPSLVVYFNEDFVALNDKFPKATIHVLLLPRSREHTLLHPFDALQDAEFLAKVRVEAGKLKSLVASELQRRLGSYSRAESARQAALNGDDVSSSSSPPPPSSSSAAPPQGQGGPMASSLPTGRDWASEIRCGVHAGPSMGNLHVHVFSRDMHSPAMKHRKHYNSFNTPFLIDLDDFPLHELDPRRNSRGEGFLRRDLKCWRCGQNFGNRFRDLKLHLEREFETWKKE